MIDNTKLHDAVSKCAWGYFFLYFDINLGSVSILPDFVGYLLFLRAISMMQEEERELGLLRPLGIFLTVWHAISWIINCFGPLPGDGFSLLSVIGLVSVIANLYFQFQFLTNLASIAKRHQSEGADIDQRLLKYRTRQTILFTVVKIIGELSVVFGNLWLYTSMALHFGCLILGICIMCLLFEFRKDMKTQLGIE